MITKSIITLSLIASILVAGDHSEDRGHRHHFKNIKSEMNKIVKRNKYQKIKRFLKNHKSKVREEIKDYKIERKALKKLTFKSKNNYNKNTYGLITTSTLTSWIDNWQKNKPSHIDGKLIILQAGPTLYANAGKSYLIPNESEGVYVYNIGLEGACDTSFKRFDGVSEIQAAILDKEMMNFQLNALNIDTNKDMVVLVSSASSDDSMKALTRIWLTLKYYNSDMKHISFLNGSASYNFSPVSGLQDYLGEITSEWPQFGSFDVANNGPEGMAILATMEDMMKASSEIIDFHFITDARGSDEFNGIKGSASSDLTCGEDGKSQCYTAFRGHIKTAKDMSYKNFYDREATEDINGDGVIDSLDASYKFKTKKELKKLFRENGYKKGQIIDAYCRTGRKSNLAMFAATAILGYPAKMYDGSWIQWGQLANSFDSNGVEILPEDNKWRTDVEKYSTIIKYEDSINVQPIVHVNYNENNTINQGNEVRIDLNGETTSLQIDEDINSVTINQDQED